MSSKMSTFVLMSLKVCFHVCGMAAKYEAFLEWPATRIKMTRKGVLKRKPSPRREDSHTQELRVQNRNDMQAGPSKKQKGSVATEAQTRTKRMKELELQQDFR